MSCSISFFLLEWRIYIDLDVAVSVTASPSGVVPGGGKGGRSKIIYDEPGLDHVLAIFYGVTVCKIKDYIAISILFRVLPVIILPPPI
jgi:hypothetical protein